MKRKVPLRRSGIARGKPKGSSGATVAPKPRKPIRRKPRTLSEAERIYGPPKRREWVTRGTCVCGREGTEEYPLHQHHTAVDGLSRKADYDTIVGLCAACHRFIDDCGQPRYERWKKVDLKAVAAETERQWRELNGEGEK